MARKAGGQGDPRTTYQVVKPAQLRAVASTIRGSIYSTVTAFGPVSVREIADLIGAAPSSLYYHVERLIAVGLLAEAGTRQAARKPEQLYDVPSRRMRMAEALRDPRNAQYLKPIVASICKQANRDFAKGYDAPGCRTSGVARNLRFGRLIFRPDADTLAKINTHLEAITELISEARDGKGGIVSLTWIMAPQARRRAK